jgi:CheY-like chemotaxis protein
MTPIKVLYVDDDPEEIRRIKTLLEASGTLRIDGQTPKYNIGDNIIVTDLPDLFLIDYELSKQYDDSPPAQYSGTTLTAAIRNVANSYPVVLLTKRSIVDPVKEQKHLSEFQLIDQLSFKDSLGDRASLNQTVDMIVGLATGYRILRQTAQAEPNWDGFLKILEARPEEAELLQLSNPPFFLQEQRSIWNPARLAIWIRHTLIAYPGILYDPVYAATELRISVDSFLSKEVQALFVEAKYNGVFSPPEGRWWKQRLEKTAMEYVGDLDYADRFAEIFQQNTGKALSPSVSIVRNETPADAVCYIYHEPVMFEYTVAYRPDNRPPIMEPARVSFKAIQQSNEVQLAFLDGVDSDFLNQIREMEL